MKSDVLVSVVLPVYNVEKYVEECIDSVLAQTYQNIEVIIVNDGSTDNSLKICQAFNDSRIHIVNKENGGLSDARNKGVEASNGEYILFVDSDDVIHPQLVERLLGNIMTYEGDIAGCNFVKFEDGNPISWDLNNYRIVQWTTEDVMRELVGSCSNELTVAVCKLYPKNMLALAPFPVGRIHEDEFVAYKILSSSIRFIYSSEKMYAYRQRPNSIMSTYNVKAEKDRMDAKQDIFEYYKENVKNTRSQSRAFFLLMRNIELSYYKIYNIRRSESYLEELVCLFDDLYKENAGILQNLNVYEKTILFVFYKSKAAYRIVERLFQKIKSTN